MSQGKAGAGDGEVRGHTLFVRVTHWINAFAVFIMIGSGWRIYDASPLFDFRFPPDLTIGGWLAGALAWHFAAMWLLAVNGVAYLSYGFVSGHFWRDLAAHTADLGLSQSASRVDDADDARQRRL